MEVSTESAQGIYGEKRRLKMARREGVDFILDPMWADIRPSLFEHIDGLSSMWKKKE